MSVKHLIYAVDDESSIRELYECALSNAGFDVVCFENGEAMFDALREKTPSLFILDIMLDGQDGYDLLTAIRKDAKTQDVPVIMVSAKGEEISKVKGLNLGADDYLAKPFGIMELIARINANLRKRSADELKTAYKDVVVKDSVHEISVCGKSVELTLKEYELLKLLVANAGTVILRNDILDAVWGKDYGETRTLDMHVASLRKILVGSAAEISTVRGVGYILK